MNDLEVKVRTSKNLYLVAKLDSGEQLCPTTALLFLFIFFKFCIFFKAQKCILGAHY